MPRGPTGQATCRRSSGWPSWPADPELKRRALIAHETALARYAPVWLRGAMIITSRRSYPDIFDDPMGVAEWFWVFFGGDLRPGTGGHALEAAVLGRAAPALIEHAANDRTEPSEVLNRFQANSAAHQISWVTHDYGVFSESFSAHPRPVRPDLPVRRPLDRETNRAVILSCGSPCRSWTRSCRRTFPAAIRTGSTSTGNPPSSTRAVCSTFAAPTARGNHATLTAWRSFPAGNWR